MKIPSIFRPVAFIFAVLLFASSLSAPVRAANVTQYNDFSGAIATASVSQMVAPFNGSRQYIWFQNVSSNVEYINFTQPASVGGAGSIELQAGQYYTSNPGLATCEQINVADANAGDKYTCKTY